MWHDDEGAASGLVGIEEGSADATCDLTIWESETAIESSDMNLRYAGRVDGNGDPRSTRMVERVRACAGQRHLGERGC